MIKIDAAFITGTFTFNRSSAVINKIDVSNPNKILDGSWIDNEVQSNAFKQIVDSGKFTICDLREIQRLDQYDFYRCVR